MAKQSRGSSPAETAAVDRSVPLADRPRASALSTAGSWWASEKGKRCLASVRGPLTLTSVGRLVRRARSRASVSSESKCCRCQGKNAGSDSVLVPRVLLKAFLINSESFLSSRSSGVVARFMTWEHRGLITAQRPERQAKGRPAEASGPPSESTAL